VRSPDDQATAAAGDGGELPATRVGPYRLIRELGRGGMGTVYLAVRSDDAFQKRVAVKILKRGMDTEAIVRRFRNERQILASLEHPHIAGLLDGGTTPDGLPYFAMEYVEGQPIDEYADAQHLDTTGRLRLFRKVCAAVQYAHQNLIIHRDLKPANVLVTADGTPKLLDFGIAKLLNPELGGATLAPTVAGFNLMTPEYASPEQVRGEAVTTATDVYSLGVLLYELLTGRRPYRLNSRSPEEIARVVCNSTPVRPSTAVTRVADFAGSDAVTGEPAVTLAEIHFTGTGRQRAVDPERLSRRLAGDLDNIVLKALSKEPGRRYLSVDQFSEDVRRHLQGLPVIARKDTLGYRTAKFVRRNRAAVAGAAAVFLALVGGIVGTTWQARVARAERARAEQRFNDVRHLANSFLFEVHDAVRDLPGSTPARRLMVTRGLEYLDKLSQDAGNRPDLQRELANAYLRVGDVQGRPLNPNLGDTAGALASYEKSTALFDALAGAGADATLERERANAYVRMSEVLSSTGDTARALEFARRALALQQKVTGVTSPLDARNALAATHSRVGDLLSATGDTRGALEERRRALALMEAIAAASPADPVTIRQLGVAHQKLGNSLGNPNYPNVGDLEGALVQLEKSGAVFRNGVALHPNNAVFQRNLGIIDSNVADVLLALGRRDEALRRQMQARATFEALAAADPTNVAAKDDIAISRSKRGEMLVANGQSKEAIAEFEGALAIHQGLSAGDPQNRKFKLEVASDHNRLATAQMNVGLRGPSLANHGQAVAMSRELSAANPENVELRVAVALALAGRGDAWLLFAKSAPTRAADLANAERDYVEAVSILEKLQEEGNIGGTDLETLDNARKVLGTIREERAGQ
jgi:non-specific serine/threonine protein kinase/serine/threonine-protein kinase